MKFNFLFLTSLVTSTSLASLTGKNGVLQLDFDVKYPEPVAEETRLGARGVPVSGFLDRRGSYYVNITVGSNKQPLYVLVDTGSGDLWIPGEGSGVTGGSFDPDASTSYLDTGKKFSIGYLDGRTAAGNWSQDLISFNGVTIKDANFALATKFGGSFRFSSGILGLSSSKAGYASAMKGTLRANFPIQLRQQGIIGKTVYSVYLNNTGTTTGSIVFGGIDTAKFTGPLGGLPAVPLSSLQCAIKSMLFKGKVLTTMPFNAAFDTGATLGFFPADIVTALGTQLGFTLQANLFYEGPVPSLLADTLDFEFQGVTIKVPLKEFIYVLNSKTARLNVNSHSSNFGLIGQNFLRFVYAVYDLEDSYIYFAQAKLDATDLNVVPVVSSIPGAKY